ncbi:MAG: hypothetical protein JWR15_1900, partial [Prosthecobacter sp.]|nr:hypothetical protein [Prosthecobacter sp.]
MALQIERGWVGGEHRTRGSVLECGGKLARRRFRRPDGNLWPEIVMHRLKAVSPMQACAVHLCHRTP